MAANVRPVCVAPRQLDMRDPVYQCVSQLSELLEPWQTSSFLRNGKIEMQLKLFIGAAWERGNPGARAFVMDKAFYLPGKASYPSGKDEKQRRKKKGGLDLVALEDGEPRFWIETKCSFFEDEGNGLECASSALSQADRTADSLIAELQRCPVYLVHFVNSIPDASHYPDFVSRKFARLRAGAGARRLRSGRTDAQMREAHLENLQMYYAAHRGERQYEASAVVDIYAPAILEGIIVKLT
jgi:hypothetical protein